MNVLVACEESQRVAMSFRDKGDIMLLAATFYRARGGIQNIIYKAMRWEF